MRLSGHCLGIATSILIGLSLCGSTVSAQQLPFNPSASNPTPELPAIRKYIDAQIPVLSGSDRNAVISARESLLSPISGSVSPSAAFVDVYTLEVSDRISKALVSNDSHVKINTAIVIERMTNSTGSTKFATQIATLIGDNSPAVSIWGLRAATPIVLELAGTPNGVFVFTNLQSAVTVHSDNAAVVEEAYNALTTVLKNDPQRLAKLGAKKAVVLNAIVDEIQLLLETRLASEMNSPRPGPMLDERGGLRFLLLPNIWKELNDAQKTRSVQLMIELLRTSLTRVMAGRDPAATPEVVALGVEHNELIRRSGGLLAVLADIIKEPGLAKQANEVRRVGPAVADDKFADAITTVSDTLNKLYPKPAATTAAPATQPV